MPVILATRIFVILQLATHGTRNSHIYHTQQDTGKHVTMGEKVVVEELSLPFMGYAKIFGVDRLL